MDECLLIDYNYIVLGKGSFKHYLSITGYAYVIMLLYIILNTVVSFFTGNLKLDFSLGIMASSLVQEYKGDFLFGFMYTILKSIDFFSIWQYIVIAIGITEVGKLSKAKAYTVVSIIFIVGMLLGAVLAGVSEMYSGTISSQI